METPCTAAHPVKTAGAKTQTGCREPLMAEPFFYTNLDKGAGKNVI